ncbi:MAG: thioredoxin family protein [Candidatus Muiribacteriaceae bacterium]
MKTIQILGTGCPKCKSLMENAEKAIEQKGGEYKLEKIEDLTEIMNMGVMMTPALAIDGEVKSSGKVLSPEDIINLL